MSSCQLMLSGVRSFMVFSSFKFKPPDSGFQSYSYSSLKISLYNSVNLFGFLGCGEHLGNRLLARSVSFLLTPPLLLLVTSISILSMQLCKLLWVSLIVEKLFIINIDVLSSVLYRWRSLEATVRIRLKSRGRRLKIKT